MLPVGYTSDPLVEDGETVGAVVIFRDVSERRRTSEEAESRFESLLEDSREGLVLTENGVVFEANSAFLRTFGYTREEAIGMGAEEFVLSEDQGDVETRVSSGNMET